MKVVGALSCKRRARKPEDFPALFLTLRDVSHVHLLARKLAFEFALIAECVEMPDALRVVVSIQAPILLGATNCARRLRRFVSIQHPEGWTL